MDEARIETDNERSELRAYSSEARWRAPITFLEAAKKVRFSLETARVGFLLEWDLSSPQMSFI